MIDCDRLPAGPPRPAQIDPTAHVHATAILGPGTSVGAFAVIGAGATVGENTAVHAGAVVGRFCTLGRDCVLHPGVVLYDDCALGDRVRVHAGATLGADGFGYRTRHGRHVKVPQLGWVEVADDVEIGAGSTIDRGTFGPTRVGAGTKLGGLAQVGHNCQVGRHNLLAGQVGLAGSCATGDGVGLADRVGLADHVRVGAGAAVAAGSGVTGNVPAGTRVRQLPGPARGRGLADGRRRGGTTGAAGGGAPPPRAPRFGARRASPGRSPGPIAPRGFHGTTAAVTLPDTRLSYLYLYLSWRLPETVLRCLAGISPVSATSIPGRLKGSFGRIRSRPLLPESSPWSSPLPHPTTWLP